MRSSKRPGASISSFERALKGPFFEKNPLPMWIFDPESFHFLAVNEAAIQRCGYTRSEFLKMKATEIRPPEDVERFAKAVPGVSDSGFQPKGEWRLKAKNGETINVEVHATRVQFRHKKAVLSIIHDVTERKKTEEGMKLYGLLFKNLSEMVLCIRQKDQRIIEANEAAQKAFGYTRAELLSKTISDLRPPGSQESIPVRFSGQDSVVQTYETINQRKDGSTFHVEVTLKRLIFESEQVIVGIARDLTERRRAEAALHESEAKYHDLIETMPDGYYLSTSAGRFVEVNPAFCRMLGYSNDEMLAMNIPETLYFHPSERKGEFRFSGFSPASEVYRLKRKDGTEAWFEDSARYILDESGKIIYHEGISRDITDRKHAEEALKASESRFRAVIENIYDAIIFLDEKGKITDCLNPRSLERFTGLAMNAQMGKSAFESVHPDDMANVRNKFSLTSKQGEPFSVEYRVKSRDNSWTWVEAAGRNMLSDPLIKSIVVHIREIEDRKRAQMLLIESEERYRMLVDKSPDAIVVYRDEKVVYVNPASLKPMAADSAEQLIGISIFDFVHPDSKDIVVSRVKEMMRTQKAPPLQEMKILGLDGKTLEAEVRAAPVPYLGKPSIQLVIRDITPRKKVEEQLRLQSVALNTAANGIVITDRDGHIVWANSAFESLTGYTIAEALGKNPREIIRSGKHDREFYKSLWDTILSGRVWRGEIINKRKDGNLYTEEMTIAPVRDDHAEITHFVAVKQDISDRKLLQEQFLQSQKLESIGQLAGGVAHDYNNILSVIIGYAHLLKRKFKGDPENEKPLDAILAAARRAASLTEQLLVFARKEMISPKIINVNSSIESIEKMLQRIIGENINLVFHPGRDVRNIKIDPSQFDQILVNLATNSRDAIKGIGTIAIETMNVSIDEDYVKYHAGLTVGEFVKLSFTDTGMGMDEETVKRIFEPFFTTKEKGQGTGLGLSTVYGIVKQNNGYIYATSKLGEGTTFEIYLPPSYEEADRTLEQSSEISVLGTETILVVEDQVDILELTKASLEKYGFCVLTAIEPNEALRLCESYDGTIHLLLTDVIMPVMSGKSLRERVKTLRPKIKTLFMSGYTANELSPEGILAEGIDFIQKPFTPAELANKVSEVLRA